MERVTLSIDEFNELNPEEVSLSFIIGPDDILIINGEDLITSNINHPCTLFQGYEYYTDDKNGNSYQLSGIVNGLLRIIDVSYQRLPEPIISTLVNELDNSKMITDDF